MTVAVTVDEMPALWAADGPQVCQTAAEQMDALVSELDGCTGGYLVLRLYSNLVLLSVS